MSGRRAKAIRKMVLADMPALIKKFGRQCRPFKNLNRLYKEAYMRGDLICLSATP